MPAPRRKLTAVDDPLAAGPPTASSPTPAPPRERAPAGETAALYVRLRLQEADRLAHAAFELRVHKRELVGALIARHVDWTTDEGREALRGLVAGYRDSRTSR
jgi:hypothetical protein